MADTFPPTGPVTTRLVIPSYLYQQYNDDENLQAFVDAYNEIAQAYTDWFNDVSLPIYTGLSGALLDWVAAGLYGMTRPALPSGFNKNIGTYNTYAYNTFAMDAHKVVGPSDYTATSDDTYKRILTWHFYKGDGAQFNVDWLKRRVMRFLVGANGSAPLIDSTYQISVTFGVADEVTIRITKGQRALTSKAVYNAFIMNNSVYNGFNSIFIPAVPMAYAPLFKAAVQAGVLQLPFQYTFDVVIV